MQDEIYFHEMRQVGPRPVWQITPPANRPVHTADELASGGPAATPQGGYPLTDHGGSTIHMPKLALVYLGPWWGDTTKAEAFAGDLMTAGYLAPLSAYGSGQGSFIGAVRVFQSDTPPSTITDAELQQSLADLIRAGSVPAPDANTLYALLLPEGVTVQQGGSASCSAFCGYHDAFSLPSGQTVFYTVQPSPNCSGCLPPGVTPFDVFTAVLAHEVAEACTDAVPGEGWFNDQTGMENSDEFSWIFGAYGPWNVQFYEVNGNGSSQDLIQYSPPAQPGPQPQPEPQPAPQCGATVDTEFAQLATLVRAAATSDPANAWWYNGGLIWLAWAQQNVDAALAAVGNGQSAVRSGSLSLAGVGEGEGETQAAAVSQAAPDRRELPAPLMADR